MPYFKDKNNTVYYFTLDEVVSGWAKHLTSITEKEAKELTNPPSQEADPVDVVSVSMRQARLALLSIGKLSEVEELIDSLEEPLRTQVKIEWDYAMEVRKDWPQLTAFAEQLELSESDLTTLFNHAATL